MSTTKVRLNFWRYSQKLSALLTTSDGDALTLPCQTSPVLHHLPRDTYKKCLQFHLHGSLHLIFCSSGCMIAVFPPSFGPSVQSLSPRQEFPPVTIISHNVRAQREPRMHRGDDSNKINQWRKWSLNLKKLQHFIIHLWYFFSFPLPAAVTLMTPTQHQHLKCL